MKFHTRHGRYLFGWVISILLVSSCTFKIERLDQPIATMPLPVALPAVTAITDTPAPLPTMESMPPTPTAQTAAEVSLEQECIPIEEQMPDDLSLSGIWVRGPGSPYLEPMDGSGMAYRIPLKGGGLFSTSKGDTAVSPDGRYLAYIDSYLDDTGNRTKSRVLRIVDSAGHPVPMGYWLIDWQWLIGWLDNRHIAVFTGNKEILVVEPFTGKWERLPKPSWLHSMDYDYEGNDGPFYSPNLDSILVRPDYSTFELRDFQTGQTIYKGSGDPHGWDLGWSADGSTLAIGSEKFLHVIAGSQQYLELDTSKFDIGSVRYTKLSPDGQKLVFTSYPSGELFSFDLEQSKITKLCTGGFNFLTEAVWSPDSRFVVQPTYTSYSDQFDLLIDTQQLRAYKLISGQYHHRLAWLAEP